MHQVVLGGDTRWTAAVGPRYTWRRGSGPDPRIRSLPPPTLVRLPARRGPSTPRPGRRYGVLECRSARRSTHPTSRPSARGRHSSSPGPAHRRRFLRSGFSCRWDLTAVLPRQAFLDIKLNQLVHPAFRQSLGLDDRVLDRLRRGTTVTDHADAVDAQERRSTELGIIDAPAEAGQGTGHEEIGKA